MALVAHSFGGLILKSLVVEAHKHVHQRRKNDLDDEVHKCCETTFNNVKGVIKLHKTGSQYGVKQDVKAAGQHGA